MALSNNFHSSPSLAYICPSDTQTSDYSEGYIQDRRYGYICPIPDCGKRFKFKSEMARHNVIHFNNRPHNCPFQGCTKTFKRNDALEAHLRIHTKEMPFICDLPECRKSFATKVSLKYHILKHNNYCAFKCSFPGCSKAFYTKGQVKQHEKAFKYHINLVKEQFKENEQSISVFSSSKDQDDYKEFYVESLSPIKNFGLEETQDESPQDLFEKERKQPERFEKFMNCALMEDELVKIKPHFVENEVNFFADDLEPSEAINVSDVVIDELELKIMDFLKEKEVESIEDSFLVFSQG